MKYSTCALFGPSITWTVLNNERHASLRISCFDCRFDYSMFPGQRLYKGPLKNLRVLEDVPAEMIMDFCTPEFDEK